MLDRVFYHIWQKFKFNGNDVFFLKNGDTSQLTNNVDLAAVFTLEQASEILKTGDFSMIEVVDAQRLSCFHVPASKLKKEDIEEGEPVLLLCKRDQCGKNAAFWFFNNSGYGSDFRASQIFTYKKDMRCREFEYYVKYSKAVKASEKRLDVQDISNRRDRLAHHSIEYTKQMLDKIITEQA